MTKNYLIMFLLFVVTTIQAQTIPEAVINRTWIEHRITKNGTLGMNVHAEIEINNCQNRTGSMNVFIKDSNGNFHKDTDGKYCTSDGAVLFKASLTPLYKSSIYKDACVFVPYKDIHMYSGQHNYSCVVYVWMENKYIGQGKDISFVGTGKSKGSLLAANQNKKETHNRTNLPNGGYQEYVRNEDGSLTMNTYTPCAFCNGTKTCHGCFGTGGRVLYGVYYPCTLCGGRNVCHACHGKGGTYASVLIKGNTATGNDSDGGKYISNGNSATYYDATGRAFIHNGNSSGSNNTPKTTNSSNSRYGNISCHLCFGTGVCQTCNGKGIADSPYTGGYMDCPNCYTGHKGKCSKCGGTGKVYGLK